LLATVVAVSRPIAVVWLDTVAGFVLEARDVLGLKLGEILLRSLTQ
jgi:hypothetical protein